VAVSYLTLTIQARLMTPIRFEIRFIPRRVRGFSLR
jgi:hypothetical protein